MIEVLNEARHCFMCLTYCQAVLSNSVLVSIYEHAVSIEIYSIFKQAAGMKCNVGRVGDAVGILHV